MKELPADKTCINSGFLCTNCQARLDAGEITEFEIDLAKDLLELEEVNEKFGFLKDIQLLRENGLAKGGSLDNAIVIDDFRIINEDGLRYKDEFVRHKILDFIGDLAILGSPIIGHFDVQKSGHFLNQTMLKKLISHQKYWKVYIFKNPEECTQNSVKIPTFGHLEPVPA